MALLVLGRTVLHQFFIQSEHFSTKNSHHFTAFGAGTDNDRAWGRRHDPALRVAMRAFHVNQR